MSIEDCTIIELPKISDERGNLVYLEQDKDFQFSIKRNYLIYGVKEGESRGYHAHKELEQLMICLAGEVTIDLYDGVNKKTFILNSPNKALYVCPMIWRVLRNFGRESCLSVLASERFNPEDYIRNIDEFKELARIYTNKAK